MITWLKSLCGTLGVVAFFSLLALSPTANAASLKSSTLAKPSSESCHHGSMEVQPSADNTFKANGQPISVTWVSDHGWAIATFPDLPQGTYVKLEVPAHTSLKLNECDFLKVTGINGPMILSAPGGLTVSNVRLEGYSTLDAQGGSLSFDGSLDKYSDSTFHADGNVDVKLPKSDSFHIDATTTDPWGHVNVNPSGSLCPPNTNVCHGDNNLQGQMAKLTLSARWNININLV
jgi:hypothetical protein